MGAVEKLTRLFAAVLALAASGAAGAKPTLILLARRSVYVLAPSGTATRATAALANADRADLRLYSVEWFATTAKPGGYDPVSADDWHKAMDGAALSASSEQAGYQPDLGAVMTGDRRLALNVRYQVETIYRPLYIEDASSATDALKKANAHYVDAIYSAGRAMDYFEWAAYTRGFTREKVDLSWFHPTPLPWAALIGLPAFTVTERRSSIPKNAAPYDAAVWLPSGSSYGDAS